MSTLLNKSGRVLLTVMSACRRIQREFTRRLIDRNEAVRQLHAVEDAAYKDDLDAEPDGDITYLVASTVARLDKLGIYVDRERLDWLEKHPEVRFTRHGLFWYKITPGRKGESISRFKTLREAIDADIQGKIR